MPETKGKVLWGKTALQFKEILDGIKSKELASKKITEVKKDTRSLFEKNPQEAIIKGRLQRFRPTIKSYCVSYCMKGLGKEDFKHAIKGACSKILAECGNLSKVLLTKKMIYSITDSIGDEIERIISSFPEKKLNINEANNLIHVIINSIDSVLTNRLAMNDWERISGKEADTQSKPDSLSSLLETLPEDTKRNIKTKLLQIGIDPSNNESMNNLLKTLGLDPQQTIDSLKKGEVPDTLKKLL